MFLGAGRIVGSLFRHRGDELIRLAGACKPGTVESRGVERGLRESAIDETTRFGRIVRHQCGFGQLKEHLGRRIRIDWSGTKLRA